MSVASLKSVEDLPEANARLAAEVAKATGTRAGSLADVAWKTRRYFPRKLIDEMTFLAESEEDIQNPKTMRMIDLERAERAYRDVLLRAEKLDLKTDRERMVFGVLSGLAFNLIVLAVAIIGVMVWRGLI
jgi:hypothetical protein